MSAELAARIRLDLDWISSAPPLMSADYWQSRALRLASAPVAGPLAPATIAGLESWLDEQRPRPKVGRWFERIHDTLLAADARVELLAHQRPLRDSGRTVGELDALYRRDHEVVHREIAVKFYLAVEDSEDPALWWGPSKRDRLDLKLQRLCDHQLRLAQLAGEAWPAELPRPGRAEALMLGALFHRPGGLRRPAGSHPQVALGHWYFASEFEAEQRGQARWVHLDKPWWLSPQQVRFSQPLSSELPRHPILVGHDGEEGPVRAFVVPDGWWKNEAGA